MYISLYLEATLSLSLSHSLKMEGSVEETAKAVSDLTMDSAAPGETQSKKYLSLSLSLYIYIYIYISCYLLVWLLRKLAGNRKRNNRIFWLSISFFIYIKCFASARKKELKNKQREEERRRKEEEKAAKQVFNFFLKVFLFYLLSKMWTLIQKQTIFSNARDLKNLSAFFFFL